MDEILKQVRHLVEQRIGKEGISFEFEWEGPLRVPKIVTFPDGSSKEVGYMRDGSIIFQDETVGKYERIVDDPKQPKQKIRITSKGSR